MQKAQGLAVLLIAKRGPCDDTLSDAIESAVKLLEMTMGSKIMHLYSLDL